MTQNNILFLNFHLNSGTCTVQCSSTKTNVTHISKLSITNRCFQNKITVFTFPIDVNTQCVFCISCIMNRSRKHEAMSIFYRQLLLKTSFSLFDRCNFLNYAQPCRLSIAVLNLILFLLKPYTTTPHLQCNCLLLSVISMWKYATKLVFATIALHSSVLC